MDLRLLRYFVACVEHKTMHAAAAAANVSQPALSKAINNLEAGLGVRLLERQPRGVVPTSYGLTLFRYAKMIDSEMRRAVAEIDAMRGMTRGTVVVGVIPTMCVIMGDVIAQVMESHPGLRLKLRVGFSAEMIAALRNGEIDIALLLPPPGEALTGLVFDPLVHTSPVVAVREDHPLADRRDVSLHDLSLYPWAIPDYPSSHRQIVNQVFIDAGLTPPLPVIDVSTVVFFASMIAKTDLITIAPATLINSLGSGPHLVALDIDFDFPTEQVGMAYRENTTLLPGARVVMDLARAFFAQLPQPSLR